MPGAKQIKWQNKLRDWNENPKSLDEINTILFKNFLLDFPPRRISNKPLSKFKTLKSMIEHLYKMFPSKYKVGAIFNVSETTMLFKMRELGIEIQRKGGSTEARAIRANKKNAVYALAREGKTKDKTAVEIAKIVGCSPSYISYLRQRKFFQHRDGRSNK